MKKIVGFFFLITMLAACAPNKYAKTNRVYKKQVREYAREIARTPLGDSRSTWVGTTNFNLRKPEYVVIHHTAQNSCEQTLRTFTLPSTQVSAHYVVCKNGKIHHMLNDYLRAWHGGIGSWGGNSDINSASVGIELDNNGFEPFPDAQMNSLLALLDTLKKKYSVPTTHFIGHADIAPTRKNDPNVQFPWSRLAEQGFGLWHRDTTYTTVPADFNALHALRIVGYSVKDSSAAVRAFKRHFLATEDPSPLNEKERKVLYDLMEQSL